MAAGERHPFGDELASSIVEAMQNLAVHIEIDVGYAGGRRRFARAGGVVVLRMNRCHQRPRPNLAVTDLREPAISMAYGGRQYNLGAGLVDGRLTFSCHTSLRIRPPVRP